MRANRRGQRVGPGSVHTATAAVFVLALATASGAQDSGQINIRLTVPTRIDTRVDVAPAVTRSRRVCIGSRDSVPFSVASLITDDGSWKLRPLPSAATAGPGVCAGMMFSIAATDGDVVTLVLSPQ